jgi:hypothetical protein
MSMADNTGRNHVPSVPRAPMTLRPDCPCLMPAVNMFESGTPAASISCKRVIKQRYRCQCKHADADNG